MLTKQTNSQKIREKTQKHRNELPMLLHLRTKPQKSQRHSKTTRPTHTRRFTIPETRTLNHSTRHRTKTRRQNNRQHK